MKIAVAGTGYVGLSIATLLAQNHEVTAVDIVPEKINLINKSENFYEICRESFKFIGRVLYYNNYHDLALKFFLESKNRFYRKLRTCKKVGSSSNSFF